MLGLAAWIWHLAIYYHVSTRATKWTQIPTALKGSPLPSLFYYLCYPQLTMYDSLTLFLHDLFLFFWWKPKWRKFKSPVLLTFHSLLYICQVDLRHYCIIITRCLFHHRLPCCLRISKKYKLHILFHLSLSIYGWSPSIPRRKYLAISQEKYS